MDKYEYKLRAEEIKKLISQKKYKEAAQVADSIEWTRVKSVMMLCTVSDLYKANRRFDDAKTLLDMANERHPYGRMIIYSLCDLAIKMGEIVQAVEYYKDFVQIAPNDSSRYVLQYKIYEAQDVGLEERIAVLEELKKRDYRERWAYELAYLYHRVGLASKCVEECDDLILWFGEGKYVIKAMELKMLHQALSPTQQHKYDVYAARKQGHNISEERVQRSADIADFPTSDKNGQEEELDIHVKPMDMGKYNTINLQAELAESMKEVMQAGGNADEMWKEPESYQGFSGEESTYGTAEEPQPTHETLLAMEDERYQHDVTRAMPDTEEWAAAQNLRAADRQDTKEEAGEAEPLETADTAELGRSEKEADAVVTASGEDGLSSAGHGTDRNRPPDTYTGMHTVNKMKRPEERAELDKQVTSQLSIEDIMSEWERMKLENEERRRQQLKEKVLQQTGNLFSDFDKAARTGVLEGVQIKERVSVEAGKAAAALAVSADPVHAVDTEMTKIWSARDVQEAARNNKKDSLLNPKEENSSDVMDDMNNDEEDGRYVVNDDRGSREMREDEDAVSGEPAVNEDGYETDTRDGYDQEPYGFGEPEEYDSDERQEGSYSSDAEESIPSRSMSTVEKKLFFTFVPTKGAVRQLTRALDMLSLTSYTGNLILTGETGSDYMQLAKNIVKVVRSRDHGFSGKMAKINGLTVNTKDASALVGKMEGGALVIENAGEISQDGAQKLIEALNQDGASILVILVDSKRMMKHLLEDCPWLEKFFNARFDIEALDNATLVEYGCQYARAQEYTIDEFGELALHTRIEDIQTSDHIVNIMDVRQIVDEAIAHANRKTPKHFVDVILGKRYGDDDMIVLHEKDFI